MTKKITQKEFWELMGRIGMPKDIYGYDGLINRISMLLAHEADKNREEGYIRMAEVNDSYANLLYEFLDTRGYYDNTPTRQGK